MYHSGNLSLTYAVHSGIMLFMDMNKSVDLDCSGDIDVSLAVDGTVIVSFYSQPYTLYLRNPRQLLYRLQVVLSREDAALEFPRDMRTWMRG